MADLFRIIDRHGKPIGYSPRPQFIGQKPFCDSKDVRALSQTNQDQAA